MTLADLADRTAHPRLAILVAAGLVLLVAGGAIAIAAPHARVATRVLGFRVGFLGFLLFVFGASGYVALAVFETHPQR